MTRTYVPPGEATLRWVIRSVDPRGRVCTVAPLTGGITAHMDRIRVEAPTGLREVVLRRWPDDEWADGLVVRDRVAEVVREAVDAVQ